MNNEQTVGRFKKGHKSWCKGLTKETDKRINGGRMKGCISWNKGLTKETDPRVLKMANTRILRNVEHPENISRGPKHSNAVRRGTEGKYKEYLYNILDASSRTVRNILIRLDLPCSFCGWNEYACDLHHIHGRVVEDADEYSNLAYLCPNCHRLADSGIIPIEWLTPVSVYFPDNWREQYFG